MFEPLLDGVTIILCIVGFWAIARGRLDKEVGRKSRTGVPWLLVLASIVVRFWFGDDPVLELLLQVGRDIGLGLLAGAFLLWLKSHTSRAWIGFGGLLVACWVVVSLGGWLFGDAAPDDAATTRFLLELGPDDDITEVDALLEKHDATSERAFPNVTMAEDEDLAQVFIVTCQEDDAKALMSELRSDGENVDHVELDHEVRAIPILSGDAVSTPLGTHTANDPRISEQWGLDFVDTDKALDRLRSATPAEVATVAIVDTGVDSTHEDLVGVFRDSPGDDDPHGHGSHCAGIAAAHTNNSVGMASLNWESRFVRITGYKALSSSGSGTSESVAQAIIDAAEDGADVISLSLGGYHPKPPKVEVDAIEYAHKLGCIVVVAAGNSNEDARDHAPANIPGVIVVAAIDENGRKAGFSNTNTSLDRPIAAPGVNVLSLASGGGYKPLSGTSMATPMVAGLLGVMRAFEPRLTPAKAYEILHQSGIPNEDDGRIGRVIDASSALMSLGI